MPMEGMSGLPASHDAEIRPDRDFLGGRGAVWGCGAVPVATGRRVSYSGPGRPEVQEGGDSREKASTGPASRTPKRPAQQEE